MTKSFAKLMATAGALSLLASAIPFAGVCADEATALFEYEKVDGGVVITQWNDITVEEATIPATVTEGDEELAVVGVADYAFGLCEDLAVINVPDTLTLDNMGNVAFLTSTMVYDYLDAKLADKSSVEEIVEYLLSKFEISDDADIADIIEKLNDIDLSEAKTIKAKIMTIIKNIDTLDLSQTNIDKFNIYVTAIPYGDLTLVGDAGTEEEPSEIYTYALYKNINFVSSSADYLVGDANGDGKVSALDAAYIANALANGNDSIQDNLAADFNGDGKVSALDAAAIANALANGLI